MQNKLLSLSQFNVFKLSSKFDRKDEVGCPAFVMDDLRARICMTILDLSGSQRL